MDQNQTNPVVSSTTDDIEKNKMMAIIAYLVFFVPLLTEAKDSPFVKFHVKQSITLLIVAVVGNIIAGIIPVLGWFLLAPLLSLASIILLVMGILNAANGKMVPLPIIGKYAEQYLKF